MKKLVITEPEYVKAERIFDDSEFEVVVAPPNEAGLAAAITASGAKAAVVGVEKYSGPLYDALADGGIIARFGVGCDGIDFDQAKSKGVAVANTPGALDQSVAEIAVSLICSIARNIPRLNEEVKSGGFAPIRGIELKGKTLGLVGFGAIAKKVAEIAALGFKMRVLAYDVLSDDDILAQSELTRSEYAAANHAEILFDDWRSMVSECDFVSSHIPANKHTEKFFDAAKFAAFKEGAYFINTSRGAVVDEVALFDALESGHLRGAALDVFQNEPYSPISPEKDLRKRSDVIMTPHVASNTVESNAKMATMALECVRKHLAD
jgi:phosphoglycerate dehydrogenase-like enzyme